MSTKAKTVDITILGRSYKVACTDEERDSLAEAAAYVDRKMGEIREGGKTASGERLAVMAALNIAHELLSRGGPAAPAQAAASAQAPGFDMENAKRRMQSMQATLDEALAQQEKLL